MSVFERILQQLDDADGVTEKTASEDNAPPEKTAEERMLEVVKSVSDGTKTAAEQPQGGTPAQELEQMAKQAQEAEQDLLLKQAHTMGAAVADGFMERFAQYDVALSEQGVKTASTPDSETIKQAAQKGYQQAVTEMEKRAEEEYERGYVEQLQQIYKTAAEIHYSGQAVAHNIVEQHRANKQ